MIRRPGVRRLTLALAASLLLGCTSLPTGPAQRPEFYPDRSTPEQAWASFLWAWREGDVPALRQLTGWVLKEELENDIRRVGEEEVGEFFRRDAQRLEVVEGEWTQRWEQAAYLRVTLRSETLEAVVVDFSFVLRADGWVLTQKRAVKAETG